MKKATKGALAMVLVGSVTFSVTNALLVDHSTKKVAQIHTSTHSGVQKTASDTNQTEKIVKAQPSITEVNHIQTTDSLNHEALQTDSNNGNTSYSTNDRPSTAVQKQTTTENSPSTTAKSPAPIINTEAPLTTAKGTTSTNTTATPVPATNPNPTATGAASSKASTTTAQKTSKTTTSPLNYGQEVSQTAKANGASHQNKK